MEAQGRALECPPQTVDANLMHVRARFEDEGRVPWKIDASDFVGRDSRAAPSAAL
jgi:hypothetical protein